MAEGKKTFVFYSDWINMVREMPDKDAGQLLKHVLSYVNDENPISENILVKMAFGHMKPILKRDLDKWNIQLKKYSDMGKKSAEKRALNKKQPKLTQVEPTSTVNDNVNVNITTTKEVEVDFKQINTWITEVSKSQVYLEGLYRTHKLYNGSVSELLTNFKEHLKIYPKKHNSFSDFKKHFASWLNIKKQKKELSKYQTSTKGQL